MTFTTISNNFPTVPFQKAVLRNTVNQGNVDEAKEYIQRYFFRNYDGFLFLKITRGAPVFRNEKIESIKNFIPEQLKVFGFDGKVIFDAQKWFCKQNDETYEWASKPNRPPVFSENNVRYVNSFISPSHIVQPYNQFSKETRKSVDIILNHIYEVMCSKNDELYTYFLNWISNLAMFNKNTTLLYFRSAKGTGKSIFSEFLERKVLQPHLVYISSSPSIVTGYNQNLRDKILLVLEELPCSSGAHWMEFNNKLKDFITGHSLEIQEKYKNTVRIDNNLSCIVISNNDALSVTTDQRRIVSAEISPHRMGDKQYFKDLYSAMSTQDIGAAFFCMLRERYETQNLKEFDFRTLPKTNANKDLIIEHLPAHIRFIKDNYLSFGYNFTQSFAETFDKFTKYDANAAKQMKKIIFNKKLREIGFEEKPKNINGKTAKCWNMTFEDVKNLFDKKGWIHDDDEIDNDADEKHVEFDVLQDKNSKLYDENKQLREQIAALEKKLSKLTKTDKPKTEKPKKKSRKQKFITE